MADDTPALNVAIIGGGPGGLGAAIALSELPFINVTLYEKHPESQEAGAGISLSTNAWKVFDLLGASDGVKGGSKANTHHINAYSGAILTVTVNPENSQGHACGAIRARRTRLQAALLARIVRKTLFPAHKLHFTGNTAFRVLVTRARLLERGLEDITNTTSWWWGKTGHLYFSDVDYAREVAEGGTNANPLFEFTVRSYNEPGTPGTVPWGIRASNEKVRARVEKYDQRIRDAVNTVQEGEWRQFATFAGPRLERITGWG
ncbi:hypothetical protein BDV19DRAFT_387900 [Aspergillus venezuelensis]